MIAVVCGMPGGDIPADADDRAEQRTAGTAAASHQQHGTLPRRPGTSNKLLPYS